MKKIALTFLSLIMAAPAFANIHINPDAVESIVKEYVSSDEVYPVIREYNANLRASNGTGIAASKLWNVCVAAGWNIKEPTGKAKCETFVKALVESSVIKYYQVCTDKGKVLAQKNGTIPYCIDDFFTNKFYGGTQVSVIEGIQLSKEYARIKQGDDSLQCNGKPREITVVLGATDYIIQCASKNKNATYEFVFDDLEESVDKTHQDDIQKAVCKLHDAIATTAGCTGGGTNVSSTVSCRSASCTADSAKCQNINTSLNKFGYKAEYKNGTCAIDFSSVSNETELKTAFGINNFEFCNGIQVQNNVTVEKYLKQWVAQKAGVSESAVRCDAGVKTYTGKGCKVNGITDFKDDIKTCYVGNNQIDFVFNDINEASKIYQHGGLQGMACKISGGTYSGKRCIGLDEQTCDMLRKANLQSCPECKSVRWDVTTQTCVLPSSDAAQKMEKGVNISLIVGGAVVGVVITIGTAGTAAPGALVLTSIETIGAGIELASQLNIDGIADEFLVESNKCKNSSCAERLIGKNLQRLANLQNDMQDAEVAAIDSELTRLTELIPENSDFWATIALNGLSLTENQSGFFDTNSWEPEQVWRAVGITLQLTSVFTGVGKWALRTADIEINVLNKLPRSTNVVKTKVDKAIKSAGNTPAETLTGSWSKLKQKLGIQIFKKGERIAEIERKISKLFDDMFTQKINEISELESQQARMEQEFIEKNQGMLFHGSGTDYKEGTVQALSSAWQVQEGWLPNTKTALFADPDFYQVKRYADRGIYSNSLKDLSNTYISIPIPEQFKDRFKGFIQSDLLKLSDSQQPHGYVYAVKPDGFINAGTGQSMMIGHDVERIDRITIPLDTDMIFVRQGAFSNLYDTPYYNTFLGKMAIAQQNINAGKNVLQNLEIYYQCLQELAKLLK